MPAIEEKTIFIFSYFLYSLCLTIEELELLPRADKSLVAPAAPVHQINKMENYLYFYLKRGKFQLAYSKTDLFIYLFIY